MNEQEIWTHENGPPVRPIKVAVFEARPVVAEGLAALLSGAPNIDVVGATAHLGEATRLIAEVGVQVMVFGSEDHHRPEQARALAREFDAAAAGSGRRVGLVCIVPGGRAAAEQLSSAELPTVVTTGVSLQGLRDAIEAAHRGGDGALPLQSLRRRVSSPIDQPATDSITLTRREREVLRGLADGMSTKEIALQLGISVNTVRTHVQHLMPKLGVHSRLHAAAVAVVERLVDETGESDRGTER